MIDPYSKSYPIAGAAHAVGVDLERAYTYVWANRCYYQTLDDDWLRRLHAAYHSLVAAYGEQTTTALQERLEAAVMAGDIYWPVAGWDTWPAMVPPREMPGLIRDEDGAGDPPVQPAPID